MIKAPITLRRLRKVPVANPMVLESHAQLMERNGYDIFAAQIRNLSLAIHKPQTYKREMTRLLTRGTL